MQTRLISEKLNVTINHFGAELISVKNNDSLEFIWQADKNVWARHAPVLFPVVGKLKDNFFNYENKKYELPQHGFARDMDFDLIEKTETSATFQLHENEETKKKFPFGFTLQIKYTLNQNNLSIAYTVVNPSHETIYFSVGAHPGFNCPLLSNESFEDYYLEFETDDLFITKLNNGLRTDAKEKLSLQDKKLKISKTLFNNDALVFESSQVNAVSLFSSRSEHKISLLCNNWPYLGIWAKKGNDQFVCLEPWYGIADHENSKNELVKKDGIIELAAGKEFKAQFSLIFS